MSHSRQRRAVRRGQLARQTELLEQIALALDADIDEKVQCKECGEWFKNLGSHQQYCDGVIGSSEA